MIDKFFIKMFGIVDDFMGYLFDRFISDAPKKKKNINVKSPDNRMDFPKD
tara:strand:- start:59 stop:208 length:150 start_codon:yes stop_codon:yes gene_type:complete